jgi:hypothetical protein
MANKWTSKPPLCTPIIPSWRNDPQYLKLWLPFQEGGGGKAYDLSGNRNHGTLTNVDNPPTATSGWAGSQGLRFDGSNDYVLSTLSGYLTNTAWSVAFWAYPTANTWKPIYGDGTGNHNYIMVHVGSPIALITFVDRVSVGGPYYWHIGVVTLNLWNHVVIAVDNARNMKAYINGVLYGAGAIPTDSSLGFSYIGWTSLGNNTNYYCGKLDDIRIYNRALSAGEVKELFVDRYGDFKPPRNYFLNTGTLFEATIYDTIAVTESLNKQSNIQQSDSITLAEMIRLAIDIEKQDTFEVGDSLSYFITRFQTIMDTIEITELISRQSVELVKSDSVTMIDSLVKDMDISVNDSIDIVDLLTKQVNLIISDSVSLSDGTITKQISISINDIITIIDSLSKIIDVNLDDSVEIIEILTKFITYVMPVTDTIEVTDLISGQNITIVRSDTIEMIDNVEKSITLTLEDNISLTDIIQLLIQLNLDGDSFSITVADPAIIVATRRFRITVNIKKGQGSNILKKGQTTIEKL